MATIGPTHLVRSAPHERDYEVEMRKLIASLLFEAETLLRQAKFESQTREENCRRADARVVSAKQHLVHLSWNNATLGNRLSRTLEAYIESTKSSDFILEVDIRCLEDAQMMVLGRLRYNLARCLRAISLVRTCSGQSPV